MLMVAFKLFRSLLKAYWFLAYSLLVSFAIYVTFYLLYLPPAQHVKPVYFTYSTSCNNPASDYCSFPEASIMLHDSSKAAKDGARVLARGQAYDIVLELKVPTSNQNHEAGVFLVQIDLMSKDHKVIESSKRPVLVPFESNDMKSISAWIRFIPLLFGLTEEKLLMEIPLIEDYHDDSYHPAVTINMKLHSKKIQWYSANLKISAVFTGVRYYMHSWPLTSSFLLFTIIFSIVSTIYLWRKVTKTTPKSNYQSTDNLSETSDDEEVETLRQNDSDHSPLGSPSRNRLRVVRKSAQTKTSEDSDSTFSDAQQISSSAEMSGNGHNKDD